MTETLETLATGLGFLEAPRADDAGNFYFADVILGGVFKRTSDGAIQTIIPERKGVGGLALNDDGAVVASGPGGLLYFNEKTRRQRMILSTVDGAPIDSINDIQPDGRGGLYAGVIDATNANAGKPMKPHPLLHVDANAVATVVWDGFKISNGMGLSPDGRRLYHSVTEVGIYVYDVKASGALENRRLLASLHDSDGLAVDAEEGIWVACYASGRIMRYGTDGTVKSTLSLPVKEVLSLTFGGEELRDLYIVTGSDFSNPAARTGAIFRTRTEVPGLATPRTRFRPLDP